MAKKVAVLAVNPVAEEFMTAELAFCRLLQKINFRLVGGLNFEVGFVNER